MSARLPAGTALLVDEAYNELTDRPQANSVVDLVGAGRNVIVSRTFSKIYGLAGLRIGYILSTPENAERINGNIMTIDLSTSALAAAIASLNDEAFMTFSKNRILEGREMILDATRRAGLDTLPDPGQFRVREGTRRGRIESAHGRARNHHPRRLREMEQLVAGQHRQDRGRAPICRSAAGGAEGLTLRRS